MGKTEHKARMEGHSSALQGLAEMAQSLFLSYQFPISFSLIIMDFSDSSEFSLVLVIKLQRAVR